MATHVQPATGASSFWMGGESLKIPYAMHADNRARLAVALKADAAFQASGKVDHTAVLFFKGGTELPEYDCDTSAPDFRQESYFNWVFGAKEYELAGLFCPATGKAALLIPRVDSSYEVWQGPGKGPEWFQDTYETEHSFHRDEVAQALAAVTGGAAAVELVFPEGVNHDSGLAHDGFGASEHDMQKELAPLFASEPAREALWNALNELRFVKSAAEQEVLRFACQVSSEAHIATMQRSYLVESGRYQVPGANMLLATRGEDEREFNASAMFRHVCLSRGLSRVGYTCICGSRERNAWLHYGHVNEPNSLRVDMGDMRLLDMGGEYHGYTADITCSWPVGGTFSAEQRNIYDAVLECVEAVLAATKPGAHNGELHVLAQRALLAGVQRRAKLFKTDDVEVLMARGMANVFMQHGLGHSLGLDVHDVGGFQPGETKKDVLAGLNIRQNLRLARNLKEGVVFTVEPGFYFNTFLLRDDNLLPELKELIDWESLERHRGVGGVRIEENVLVTATGCQVISGVPRTVEDIERVMAGGEWDVLQGRREYKIV